MKLLALLLVALASCVSAQSCDAKCRDKFSFCTGFTCDNQRNACLAACVVAPVKPPAPAPTPTPKPPAPAPQPNANAVYVIKPRRTPAPTPKIKVPKDD